MKKEYNVTITETLQMTIAVEAENLAEAVPKCLWKIFTEE